MKIYGKTKISKDDSLRINSAGIIVSILLLSFFFIQKSFGQTTVSYSSNGTYTWTCPTGVTSVTVQCWGAGGAGGGATNNSGSRGGGGAGGAYASSVISVSPGSNYPVQVGAGGNGDTNNGNSGGDSWFSSTGTVIAKGGVGGQANNGSEGTGTTSGSIGSAVYKGGNGTSGSSSRGSGGGGAGSSGNGGSGSTSWPYSGGTGGSVGGGDGGDGLSSTGNGNNGSLAGGGGSGAYTTNRSNYSGGDGADGRVDITYVLALSVSGTTTPACVGGSTGTITAMATGGSSPYSYKLNSGSYQSSNLFTGLSANTYTLQVKDNSGSTATASVTVSSYGTSSDNQNLIGTNSWIGHMYDGTNFSNYIGHFTEAETFNEGFGGSTTCFDVTSGLNTSSIYTETFSVKFRMNSTRDGLYVVDLGSDDGSRLTVDGSLIYNNWSDQGFSTKARVLINLTGSSSLLYEYYENGGSNQVIFQNLTLVLANNLTANTTQSICMGSTGSLISGDSYGTLPSGISLSGTGYQWTYSTTPGGTRTNISGATGATYTPSASVAPFNTPGTYYIYRDAILTSSNNVSPNPYTATNESNSATITVNATPTITGTTPGSRCGTGTVTLGATASTGTINWYAAASGGSSLGTGTSYTTPSISSSTTYYADATSGGCITGSRTAIIATVNASPVIQQIPSANLIAYYKFNGNANDATGNDNGTLQNSPTSTADRFNISNASYSFNGSNQYVSTANSYNNPSNFTISIWFKTGTANGGKLIGFGNSQTGSSGNYDRHLYMNNAGQIYFGVYPGYVVTINSPLSYNDNNWHMATATLSGTSGMALYIDGALVASNGSVKTAQNYTGYWKIGYDNLNGWVSIPTSYYFSGTLDDAIIEDISLDATQIATLYNSPDGAGNDGPVCAGSNLTFSATTLSGATYAWSGPNSFSSSSQNPTLTYAGAYAGTYTLVVTGTGGCTATAYTNVVSSTTAGQWTGSFTTNWNNGDNWCSGTVPTISTNVTIPSSATNMPVVTDNEHSNNLVINTGAKLTVNSSGTLQIAGTITNNGLFYDTLGTIEMSGTSAQTIPANTFYNNGVYNLIINNSNVSGVGLGGALDVYNSLAYGSTGMAFNTNDYLTLKSNASGTAYVGDMTGNTITGKVTVERFISARKGWRLLSIPTNTTQMINQAWQEGCGANLDCVSGFGTRITGAAGTAGGFDAYTALPSMQTYDYPTNTWISIPNTNASGIKTSAGYMVFVRGNRSVTSAFAPATTTVLRTKGTLYTGNQAAIAVPASAFSVIGNPYASAIDMRNITKTGVKDFFYVWDPMLSGSAGYGGYQTFSYDGSGNYVITPGGGSYGASGSVSNYIQSGQAFLVQGNSSGGSVTFKEAAKSTGSSLVSAPTAIQLPSLRVNLYGVNADSSTYMADGFLVNYGNNYSNNIDSLDALKATNSSENLSIKRDNHLLVIERRQTINTQDTIQFNLTTVKVQNYRFIINATQIYRTGLRGYFIDNYLHTSRPLNIDGSTTINFNIANIPGSYAASRFEIVFSMTPTSVLPVTFTSVKASQEGSNINVIWKVDNEMNITQYEVEKSSDGNAFSTLTITPAVANNGGSSEYSTTDFHPAQGYNYYRIKNVDINGKVTYSQVVKVQIASAPGKISIYPNPIRNNNLKLCLINQPAGSYKIRILNQLGQPVLTKQILHNTETSTEIIQLNNRLAHGVYQVEVTKPGNAMKVMKIIK